ncbi:SDR family NAD(P)-dependent oxidoreductase [Pseudonocardiaceae bacterium YIM PH 21723]|nr:SDR family NAD(P)-dependent oxidoreductase [Pseudonocardiaceae bacterium YIM PH 21723]
MSQQRLKLAGNAVVITGAASGIGRALARRLSNLGSPVAITDVNEAGLRETAEGLTGSVLIKVMDVADKDAQADFADEVRAWLPGKLAAVFNNAGVALISTVTKGDEKNDQWLHDINFHGVEYGTRAFLPILLEQDAGAIVNTSSVFGLAGMPGQSAYCAAKFAVRGYTDSLRQELRGTGVRAVNIHPGGIRTNIVRNARFTDDAMGLSDNHDELTKQFDKFTMTTPDKAAQVIHKGVDAGKARILIGADAYMFDTLTRVSPTYYYSLMNVGLSLFKRFGGK